MKKAHLQEIEKLRAENRKALAEAAELRAENKNLKTENISLRLENGKLSERVRGLSSQIYDYRERNRELRDDNIKFRAVIEYIFNKVTKKT